MEQEQLMKKKISSLPYFLLEGGALLASALIIAMFSDLVTTEGIMSEMAPYWGGIISLLTPVLIMHFLAKKNKSQGNIQGITKRLIIWGLIILVVSTAISFVTMIYLYGQVATMDWLRAFTLTPIYGAVGTIIVLLTAILVAKKI
jgi:hypothetical protein